MNLLKVYLIIKCKNELIKTIFFLIWDHEWHNWVKNWGIKNVKAMRDDNGKL